MGHAEFGLVMTLGGMIGVLVLAQRLVWSIWGWHRPRLVPISVPVVLVIMATVVLTAGSPAPDATLVAGVAAQESPCRSAGNGIHIAERGERATVTGSLDTGADCSIWAAVEDPRTGAYWLQGPAAQLDTTWSLDLVIGPGGSDPQPLPYSVTLFAVSADTSAAWQDASLADGRLTLGALPPAATWLMGPVTVASRPGLAA